MMIVKFCARANFLFLSMKFVFQAMQYMQYFSVYRCSAIEK